MPDARLFRNIAANQQGGQTIMRHTSITYYVGIRTIRNSSHQHLLLSIVLPIAIMLFSAGQLCGHLMPKKRPPEFAIALNVGSFLAFHSSDLTDPSVVGAANFESFRALNGSATGSNFYLGLQAEWTPRKGLAIFRGLSAGLSYVDASAEFLNREQFFSAADGQSEFVDQDVYADLSYTALMMDILAYLNVPGTALDFPLGAAFALPLTSRVQQRWDRAPFGGNFSDPADALREAGYRFNDDQSVIFFPERELPEKAALLVFIKAGLSYRLKIEKLELRPVVLAGLPLNNISTLLDADFWSLQGGVNVVYPL